MATGAPFLFKLHAPNNYIVGGGFFAKCLNLPVSLAWEALGETNGARSLAEVCERIAKYRREGISPHDDPKIGCIILAEPFFLEERDWIPCPSDFSLNIVSGKDCNTGLRRGMADRDNQYVSFFRIRPCPRRRNHSHTALPERNHKQQSVIMDLFA